MWSLHHPFDLLATFSFPPSVVPSTIAVDPSERFFYVASTGGDVFHIPLFKRRAELGSRGDLEALGGGGQGAPPIKTEGQVISLK
jgi:pre-rRNA-processing protein IPI3